MCRPCGRLQVKQDVLRGHHEAGTLPFCRIGPAPPRVLGVNSGASGPEHERSCSVSGNHRGFIGDISVHSRMEPDYSIPQVSGVRCGGSGAAVVLHPRSREQEMAPQNSSLPSASILEEMGRGRLVPGNGCRIPGAPGHVALSAYIAYLLGEINLTPLTREREWVPLDPKTRSTTL